MLAVAEVEENVHLIGVEGSSDDLDVPMEALFKVAAPLMGWGRWYASKGRDGRDGVQVGAAR